MHGCSQACSISEIAMALPNPYELNNAIKTLIAGEDHDGHAANLLIQYMITIPLTSGFGFTFWRTVRRNGRGILGYVPGFGLVRTDPDDKKETKKNVVWDKARANW